MQPKPSSETLGPLWPRVRCCIRVQTAGRRSAFQHARQFVEEPVDCPLVRILQAFPKHSTVGIGEVGYELMRHGRLLAFRDEIEPVGSSDAFIVDAPDDALLRNGFGKNRVHAEMPLFGRTDRERTRRTHERLRSERPDDIAGRSHFGQELVDALGRPIERARVLYINWTGHGAAFRRHKRICPHSVRSSEAPSKRDANVAATAKGDQVGR